MCFQRKTTVTNTGLGDAQYQKLQTNQVGLGSQVEEGFTGAGKKLDTINSSVSGLGGKVDNVNTGVTTGFTNMQDLINKYNQGMNTQFDAVNAGVSNNATAMANNATTNANTLSNLQSDVTGGFDASNTRFDTIDSANATMQGAVDQGFVEQAQGFTDAQSDRDTQFATAEAARAANFATTGDVLNQGFGNATTERATNQANVLGGQNTIQSNLDTMSNTADAYATQSLENQGALRSAQDGFISNFDTYAQRYGEDTKLAQQTRADMQLANANANQRMREDIGNFANSAASDRQDISNDMDTQFAELGNTVDGGFSASNAATRSAIVANSKDNIDALNKLQYDLDTGLEDISVGQVVAARDLAKVASTQNDIDMELRQNFNQLGNAFDDSGQLIANSIDEQGNTISRSVDEQGNLLLRSFDITGGAIGEKFLNIRSTLRDLQAVQSQQGANASMGNLSPAMSGDVPTSGFASPFAATR
jgi:hypothetical protein